MTPKVCLTTMYNFGVHRRIRDGRRARALLSDKILVSKRARAQTATGARRSPANEAEAPWEAQQVPDFPTGVSGSPGDLGST